MYTVSTTRGCKVIDKPVPVREFVALISAWAEGQDPQDKWVCDSLLADYFGVAFVCGPVSATTAWRAELGLEHVKKD